MRSRLKQVAGIVLNPAFFALMLLAPAGTLYWPRALVLLAVIFLATVLTTRAVSAELMEERLRLPIRQGQPRADKFVLLAVLAAFCLAVVFIPLDVFRFHLIRPPGVIVSSLGLVLFAGGWWLATSAMVANPFASGVVRIQEERGHRLVDRGPYRIVRHPMYSAVIPLGVGMALWLESYAAAIGGLVPFALIVARIRLEEQFLRRELRGYEEYTQRTRFRLIPLVW